MPQDSGDIERKIGGSLFSLVNVPLSSFSLLCYFCFEKRKEKKRKKKEKKSHFPEPDVAASREPSFLGLNPFLLTFLGLH